jgi:hypothetical protein
LKRGRVGGGGSNDDGVLQGICVKATRRS